MSEGPGALADLKVVEAATFIFGPGAAMVLADFGAQVIKIEPPGQGDIYRHIYRHPGFPACEHNYFWLMDNRNKRSLALDLKHPRGREIFGRLVARADVFITNLPHLVLERLEIDASRLRAAHPRLIYAHATGYGQAGPEMHKPGYDITAYWARSGLMDGLARGQNEAMPPLPGMGDHPSAMSLAAGILLALYLREKTGQGTLVNSSLVGNGTWANACLVQAALCGGESMPEWHRAAVLNPLINHYRTSDGRRLLLCGMADRDWPKVVRLIEREDLLSDPRFLTTDDRRRRSAELIAILDEVFAGRPSDEWCRRLESSEVAWSLVPTAAEVGGDPQLRAAGVVVDYADPRPGVEQTVDSPLQIEAAPKVPYRIAPELGQHTREVLLEYGYAEYQIEALRAEGVIEARQ